MKTILLFLALINTAVLIGQTPSIPIGSGTSGDPYQVATLENLYWISQSSAAWGACYQQTADIDASSTSGWAGGAGWTPIGYYNSNFDKSPFTGSYDGGGHIITGLFINRSANGQGLFGYTNHAIINNLGLTGVSISSPNDYTAGLVGLNDKGSSITNCYSSGAVAGPGDYSRWVGGLVGKNNDFSTINNCYSSCNVSAEQNIGGLAGANENYASISNCYATGSVEGRANFYNHYGYSIAGGLVGDNRANVSNSYSTGAVTGKSYIGGLIGSNSVSVINSFWDVETSGRLPGYSYYPDGTGKTTAEMKDYATFYSEGGWDFMDETLNGTDNLWGLNPANNNGYPFLSYQGFTHDPVYIILTLSPSNISLSSVTFNGSAGDLSATQHGFCWNTSENPTIDNSKVELGAVTQKGNFSYDLSGLYPNTLFYLRAYAIKDGVTYYGYPKTFKTSLWQGLGTEAVPYQITNKTDLKNLSENSEWWSCHFIQTADITFNAADFESSGDFYNNGEGFIPIGSSQWSSVEFNGSYDGDGHILTGLIINRPDDYEQGFFGYTKGATVKNIGLINVNIAGSDETGGLVGYSKSSSISNSYVTGIVSGSTDAWAIGGLVGYGSSVTVSECYASGIVTVSGDGVWDVGGLIGYIDKDYANPNPSTVTDSHTDVAVTGEGEAGGLVGYSDEGSSFTNCYATGSVTGTYTGSYYYWDRTLVGGLAGYSYTSSYTNCHANGNIVANGGGAGGLIGESDHDVISHCFATGNVESFDTDGNSYIGGLAGMTYFSTLSHTSAGGEVTGHYVAGGLVGLSEDGLIEYSFAKGNVNSDESSAGGLVGDNENCNIHYCFANGNVSGPTDSDQTGWDIGGLVGWNQDGIISNSYATGNVIGWGEVGGLAGASFSGSISPPYLAEITNCYSVGNVTGTDPVYNGGLAGSNRGSVNYSHWDTETSGTTTGIGFTHPGGSSTGTTGKTTTEMKTQITFTNSGWDFTNTWAIDPSRNNGYPYLQWQNCINPTNGGIIAANQTICYGETPAAFTSTTPPSGHEVTLVYQWQLTSVSSTASFEKWGNVGTNTDTYVHVGTLTQTTWFRRLARVECDPVDWASATTSNVVEVAVRTQFTPGAMETTGETICYNGDPGIIGNVNLASGGDGFVSYQWQSSSNGTFSDAVDIGSATGTTFDPPSGLTATTTYRRMAKDGTCYAFTAGSGTWKVTVYPLTEPGSVTGGTSVCYGANSTLLTLTGQTGSVVKWQYSDNGLDWDDISGQTTTTYTAVNLTADTWFRAVVKSGVCPDAYSDDTQITIQGGFMISGYAKYDNNPQTPLDGLKITLKKSGVVQGIPVVTGTNGYYDFGGLVNGTYDLEVTSAHPSGQWQTWGGVNNTDYLLVSRHASGIAPLQTEPPVVRVAANVKTADPLITIVDANAVRNAAKYGWFMTGTTTPWFDIPKWVFSGTTTVTPITGFGLNCSNETRDIYGLCAGDVNGSYLPPNGYKTGVGTFHGMSLQLVNRGTLPITPDITFPIRAEQDMEIGAITLMLDFDASMLDITGVEMPENGGEQPWFRVSKDEGRGTKDEGRGTKGVLHIGWMSLEPVHVMRGETVLIIHTRMTNMGMTNMGITNYELPIRFTLNESPLCELADGDGNVIDNAKLTIPDASANSEMVKGRNDESGLVSVYPNPAQSTLNVEIETTSDGPMKMELVNLQGISVTLRDLTKLEAGWHKEQLDLRGFAPGVYFLRANLSGEIQIKKVIITR